MNIETPGPADFTFYGVTDPEVDAAVGMGCTIVNLTENDEGSEFDFSVGLFATGREFRGSGNTASEAIEAARQVLIQEI